MSSHPFVLAIDTSCDETAIAITQGCTVLTNIVASQVELHKPYGGVFPTVAKQAHQENIGPAIELAFKRSGLTWADIDVVAVTQGPGLAPALEVGIKKAKEVAREHHLPLLPINHIEGHALSVVARPLRRKSKKGITIPQEIAIPTPTQPVLAVIISGKHCDFILVKGWGNYQRLGWTIDDAAGECLDKVGRMLDLGYPAGPIVEEFAKLGDQDRAIRKGYEFPLPMTASGDYNLSFSGLKTAARNLLAQYPAQTRQDVYDFCAIFQHAVFRHLTHKLAKVLKDHPELTQVWLGGGVAANTELRRQLRLLLNKQATLQKSSQTLKTKSGQHQPLKLLTPYTNRLCGDNAAMVGVVAGLQLQATSSQRKKTNQANRQILVKNQSKANLLKDFEREPRLSLSSSQ